MSPYPSLILFDAPSRERCQVLRPITNTPLQALVTLNDPHFVDLARRFGQRIERAPGNRRDRLRFAFLTVLSRTPQPPEEEAFLRFLGPKPDESTWFRLAQVLLNLDETIARE